MADDTAQVVMTAREFGERIVEGAGVDIESLRHGALFAWFDKMVFRQAEPLPMNPQATVIAIFQNDDVVRVYTLARPPDPRPDSWKPGPPACYTLSKAAPTYVVETMSLEVMADEIADEWSELADGMSSAARELEAVVAHVEGMDELIHRDQLLKDLAEGIHHGIDDEDEPEEPSGVVAGDTTPPPPGPAGGVTGPTQ
jgi:hypothetical protein